MILFVDTETTGLNPRDGAKLVEIAAVDQDGKTIVDTLLDPGVAIPATATAIHGIGDADVRGKPALTDLAWFGDMLWNAERVVFYNAQFDTGFLPKGWCEPGRTHCAMMRFSAWRLATGRGARWVKLIDAAREAGHEWTGQAHRAMADTLAARSVWQFLSKEFPCLPGYPATIDGYTAAHRAWRERQAFANKAVQA